MNQPTNELSVNTRLLVGNLIDKLSPRHYICRALKVINISCNDRSIPRVSVIIPTYYRNDRLQACLESVFAQSYPNVEIIVVDGSGEGYAAPIVERLNRPEITYIAQRKDQGPHAARSEGAEHATGKYIQFLDDDDQLHPEKIEQQVHYLDKHPSVGVVYCGLKREYGDYRLPDPAVKGDVLESALSFRMSSCCTSTMLIRESLLDQIHPLTNRHGADDIGMMIELAQITDFGYVEDALIVMGEQDYNLGLSWKAVDGRHELLRRYDHLYERAPPSVRKNALAQTHAIAARLTVEETQWSPKAIVLFARATLTSSDFSPKYLIEFLFSLGGRSTYRFGSRSWRTLMKHIPTITFDQL